jgi:hypothetical protein
LRRKQQQDGHQRAVWDNPFERHVDFLLKTPLIRNTRHSQDFWRK